MRILPPLSASNKFDALLGGTQYPLDTMPVPTEPAWIPPVSRTVARVKRVEDSTRRIKIRRLS